jgi:hypothetical protein
VCIFVFDFNEITPLKLLRNNIKVKEKFSVVLVHSYHKSAQVRHFNFSLQIKALDLSPSITRPLNPKEASKVQVTSCYKCHFNQMEIKHIVDTVALFLNLISITRIHFQYFIFCNRILLVT